MASRKTQYGWMALGGLLCLSATAFILRNDGVAHGQSTEPPKPPVLDAKASEAKVETVKTPEPAPQLPAPVDVLTPAVNFASPPPLPSAQSGTTPPLLPDMKAAEAAMSLPPPGPPPADVSNINKAPAAPVTLRPVDEPASPSLALPPISAPSAGVPLAPLPPPTAPPTPTPAPVPTPEPILMPPTTATEAGVLIPVPAVQPVSFKPDTAQIPEPKTDPLLPPTAAPNKKATPESGPLAPQTPDTTPPAHADLAPSTEPPLAPNSTGPVQTYHVRGGGETMRDIAKRTLGTPDRWQEIHRLNPIFKPESALAAGAVVKVPADACLPNDEVEAVRPLPAMRPRSAPAKPKVVAPLTGTYPTNLDDKKAMTLPKALREQLGGESVLVTPGPDECLWITDQTHLDRLAEKLEHSAAREADVRVFKRLYYAQTEKAALDADGRVTVPERLAQFAGLHQEVVLIGIDDHFELWDAAKWRQYTQVKSAAAKALVAEGE